MTKRSNWVHVDDDGIEWHEFPHGDGSCALATWRVSERQCERDDPEFSDAEVTLNWDGSIEIYDRIPFLVAQVILARAKQWFDASAMPEGTKWMRPKKRVKVPA